MATVGEKLVAAVGTKTAWLDVNTHTEVYGSFDPSGTTWQTRYGAPNSIQGWPARNYTGAHASGLNSLAVDLAPKVFNVPAGTWDLSDLDFVEGATAYVLATAGEMGLLNADGNPPVVPNPPKPPVVVPSDILETVSMLRGFSGLVVFGSGRKSRIIRLESWIKSLS